MARILVMDERQDRILLDEYVHPIHIEDEHASLQIIERLAWAIRDASRTDRIALGRRRCGGPGSAPIGAGALPAFSRF
jgi:hypothetical protein